MKYGKHSVFKRIMSSKITFVVVLFAFIFLSKSVYDISEKRALSQEKVVHALTARTKLENRLVELTGKVAYLSTKEGMAAEMRSKFRLAQEGESVAVIIGGENQSASISNATTSTKLSVWRRVLRVFGM